jgi:hypothetical protein
LRSPNSWPRCQGYTAGLAQNRGDKVPDTPKCRSSWWAVSASRGNPSGRQTIMVRIVAVGVTTVGVAGEGVLAAVAVKVRRRGATVGTRLP